MNTNDSFSIAALKMLLSAVSIVIMLPMVENVTDISFYVTVSVYVLGKFIELVANISDRPLKIFFVIYIAGVIVGIVAVSMCFYAFAISSNGSENQITLIYNQVLLILTLAFGFIDIANFVYCICKLNYTKNKLNHFN